MSLACQVGPVIGLHQVGFEEVGAAELGFGEVGAAELGAGEVSVPSLASLSPRQQATGPTGSRNKLKGRCQAKLSINPPARIATTRLRTALRPAAAGAWR